MSLAKNVKSSYGIRHSINVSRLAAPIILQNREGIGMKRPIKIYVALFAVLFGAIIPYFLISQFFKGGGLFSKILFILGWELLVGMSLMPQKNGLDGYRRFVPTFKYWLSAKERKISTRGDADVVPVERVMGISGVADDGLILFENGWVGRIYEIDGFASTMLFDNDRVTVISAFESYLRGLPNNVNVSIPSQFSPLNIDLQVNNAHRRAMRQTRSELRDLAKRKEDVLRNQIATKFDTVTQWMLISSADPGTLDNQCGWFASQVRARMARGAVPADKARALELLANLYRP